MPVTPLVTDKPVLAAMAVMVWLTLEPSTSESRVAVYWTESPDEPLRTPQLGWARVQR